MVDNDNGDVHADGDVLVHNTHPHQEIALVAVGKCLIKMASCVFCADNLQSQSTLPSTCDQLCSIV